jgi:KAP family P-loop domain/PspA-Associated protein
VIVRIATEGQYEVAHDQTEELERLDRLSVQAAEAGDDTAFQAAFNDLLAFVRRGTPVPEDQLFASDVILPPPDVSLEEARAEFSGEGLVPADVAPPDTEPAPSEPAFERSSRRVTSDRWTVHDRLGYEPYAEAISAFILHRDTRPPLSIGIKGHWGAGKTSLMRMVRVNLDPDIESTPAATGKIGSSAGPATVADILTAAESAQVGGLQEPEAAETPTRPTVWFNAWMYQSTDQVWAGLADAIISQLTERLPRRERERLWIQLNLKRVDSDAVRRRVQEALIIRILPLALALMGVIIAAVGAYLLAAALSVAARPVRALAGGSVLVTSIACGITAAVRRSKLLDAPAAPAFSELVRVPNYSTNAGYLHLVSEDMRRVLTLVRATPERPVVVFVDDLDRCSYDAVTRVIEALNLFVAGDFPNCVFVLAIEPTLIAAQIDVAYKDLSTAVGDPHGGPSLGWRFLDKLIQLPVALPRPESSQIHEFILSTLSGTDESTDVDQAEVAALREQFERRAAGPEDIAALVRRYERGDRSSAAVIRAAEQEFDRRFSDGDPKVQALLDRHVQQLSRNPREIKRFINVFRFYAFVQNRREVRRLPAPDYEQVAKIAVLAVRWPHLVGVLGEQIDGRTVLEALEKAAGADIQHREDRQYSQVVATLRTSDALVDQMRSHDFRALLASAPSIGPAASGFL